jgi:hypothetical protein
MEDRCTRPRGSASRKHRTAWKTARRQAWGSAEREQRRSGVTATAQQREQQQQHNSARIPSERRADTTTALLLRPVGRPAVQHTRIPSRARQGLPLVAASSSDDGDDSKAWNPEGSRASDDSATLSQRDPGIAMTGTPKSRAAATGRSAVREQQTRFLQPRISRLESRAGSRSASAALCNQQA